MTENKLCLVHLTTLENLKVERSVPLDFFTEATAYRLKMAMVQ